MISRGSRGVTLVELAVVIVITGAFVAALSPFVQKARERAYRAACANNLRRISVALHRYALDHNDAFPVCSNVRELVHALANPDALYIEDLSVFVCPNTGHKKGPPGDIGKATVDYMYISGLKADAPPTTPICADRTHGPTLSKRDNHGQGGINVLYVNGDIRWLTAVPSGEWVKE